MTICKGEECRERCKRFVIPSIAKMRYIGVSPGQPGSGLVTTGHSGFPHISGTIGRMPRTCMVRSRSGGRGEAKPDKRGEDRLTD